MIKFSVVIPVYNSSNYLKKCLESLVNQTFNDIEIICINDGSTDDSKNIIEKYKKKYNNIKLYNITNHGQSYARNYGLSKAKGKYISFIDSDDYVDENMFNKLNEFLNDNNYDIVMFDYTTVTTDNKVLFTKEFDCVNDKNVSYKEYLFSDPCPWNKIYKKNFLDKIGFKLPEGIIYEDYCYIPTLVKYSPYIAHFKDKLYYYVYSTVSTTRNDEYKEKYADLIKATNILYDSFIGTDYMEEICFIIYYHYLYLGSLNFYKFHKFDKIDKISRFMQDKFPKWMKNKYVIKRNKKERFMAYLFYKRWYGFIRFMQNFKKLVKHEK